MITTRNEAKRLTLRELVQELLTNESHASIIRMEVKDRMVDAHQTQLYDLIARQHDREDRPIPVRASQVRIENTLANFPWRNEEPVTTWMTEMSPAALGERVKADGYRGQGMRDPDDAMQWIEQVIYANMQWNELNLQGARFWKALYGKYTKWMANGKPETMGSSQYA